MSGFKVDRDSLPKPWDDPLVFKLTRGEQAVSAEVRRDAAQEYTLAESAVGVAAFLAPDRIDAFLLALEAAVDRGFDEEHRQPLTLDWYALYPPG